MNSHPLVSICIPTYAMKGRGVEYLNHSMQKIARQTFKDFNIIISDHSEDSAIEDYCKSWNGKLEICYVRNESNRGNSSANVNNSFKHANGKIIKVLFQDDFFVDDNSLLTQVTHFLGNANHWMAVACCHSKDGINLHSPFYPLYHDQIQYGQNTISSPSVLMFKNSNVIQFDENLIWLMDVDYCKRLYDSFGLPTICNYVTIVNRQHEDQISNTLATEELKKKELEYVIEKYKKNK